MHAEIAAAVAREHTPGLSSAACSHLEAALGRSPSVLELEVYAALLCLHRDQAARGPLPLALPSGGTAALAVARGGAAGVAAALELAAVGAQPLAVLYQAPAGRAAPAVVAAGSDSLRLIAAPPSLAAQGGALAVGLLGAAAEPPGPPQVGDTVVYLGVPTGREGGPAAQGVYPPPSQLSQDRLLALLVALHQRPGLVRAARLLGAGGLAEAASGWALGVQLLLDAVPRHPPSLHPHELLLAETLPRALVIAPAERVDEVLAAAQAQAVAAVTIGQLIAEKRLRVLLKPSGAATARLVCELPLAELWAEVQPARSTQPAAGGPQAEPGLVPEHAAPAATSPTGPASPVDPRAHGSQEVPASVPAPPPPQLPGPTPQALAAALLAQLRTPVEEQPGLLRIDGPRPLVLAIRGLAPVAAPGTPVQPDRGEAARQALSSGVAAVQASGAIAAGAAWLLGGTAESLAPRLSAGGELAAASAGLGLTAAWALLAAAPSDGLVVVVGEPPAQGPLALDHFPGPGLLIAVLGFADGDSGHERATGQLCGELVRASLCAAVQPIGRGGLLLALGRACAAGAVGCTAVLPPTGGASRSAAAALVSPTPGRYLLAIPAHRQADARILASERGVPLWPLGRTGGSELVVRQSDATAESPFAEVLRIPVAVLQAALPHP